jgi:tetratricopeptide (TPR) repeat protein
VVRDVRLRSLSLTLLLTAAPWSAAWGRAQPADSLASAAELLDAGKLTEAVAILDTRLGEREDAQALLLRSTARFMLGEMETGEADLRRSLELDPTQRQGWLNLAAVELTGGDHEAAYQDFLRAEALDPQAQDNDVNLGVALLYLDRLEEASVRFERYLARQPNAGDAYYLVATNYASGGYTALALRYLGEAIRLDEKTRLNARTDPNFAHIAGSAEYQRLLATDVFVPPPGSLEARHAFKAPYSDSDARVVNAILDALGALRVPFDRRVEITPEWALVWADIRIKVMRDSPQRTVVVASAPPASFTPQAFQTRVEAMFERAEAALLRYRPTSERLGLDRLEPRER